MKKEIPILFSTPMVQAILEGRKTQTRRILKPQPHESISDIKFGYSAFTPERAIEVRGKFIVDGEKTSGSKFIKCPYGKVGDVIWVKETFFAYGYWRETTKRGKKGKFKWEFVDLTLELGYKYHYMDKPPEKSYTFISQHMAWYKRPSLFMPKEAARIWLEITDIRVEHLQEISEEDAIAEGIEEVEPNVYKDYFNDNVGFENTDNYRWNGMKGAVRSFGSLWHKINGEESWDDNPWLWVVSFKVLSTTGKPNAK